MDVEKILNQLLDTQNQIINRLDAIDAKLMKMEKTLDDVYHLLKGTHDRLEEKNREYFGHP